MNKYQKQMADAGCIQIDPKHLKEMHEKGHSFIEIAPGKFIKATLEDLRFNAEEIDDFIKKYKAGEL